MVCKNQLIPPHIPLDRQTPRSGRTSRQRCKVLLQLGMVAANTRATLSGPQAWQTKALSLLSPFCPHPSSPGRRSLMNQVKHPATGWRALLICTGRSTPQPLASLAAHLPVSPRQAARNKGGGGRQRLRPETEAGSGWRQRPFAAAMGVRNAAARPIVWDPLCSSTLSLPSHTGRSIGSRTEMALLRDALPCYRPPAFTLLYLPV